VTIEADDKTIEQLAKWEHKNPQILSYIKLHQKLLELRIEDSYLPALKADIVKLTPRFETGSSSLQFADLLPHRGQLNRLFQEASSIISEHVPGASSALENLIAQPQQLGELARVWYEGSLSHEQVEVDVDWLTVSLFFRAAFHPILINYSEALSPLVKQDSWHQKSCPVCGGKSDLAFLSKDNGARWLVCSRCDTAWLFLRLECPFCGNQEQDSLAYLASEDEVYRLYTCGKCHCYIKAIDLRRAQKEVLFPLERIITLDLDRQAHEAGYNPGWMA
jgi:Uncharacterized protein involved in formate dehydrogenase formation